MANFRLFLLVFLFCLASGARASEAFFRYFTIDWNWDSGGSCRISVSEQSTICQIKKDIEKYCHRPANQQKLAFTYTDYYSLNHPSRSIELKNGKTLGEYAVALQDKGFKIKTSGIDVSRQEPSWQMSCKKQPQ